MVSGNAVAADFAPPLPTAPREAPPQLVHKSIGIGKAQSEYLDLLRGLAAQMVLIQHALGLCFPDRGFEEYGLGGLGVQMFFLLSGFLITQSIASRAQKGTYTLTEFMVSRFARIYTPYFPAILLVALLDWFSSQSPDYAYHADYNVGTAIANLAMLQDFPLFQILRRLHIPDQPWFVKSFGSGRQFWTVSIEWWIYVTVGITAALALRGGARPWLLIVLVLAAIEPAYNFVGGPGDSLTFTWIVGSAACLLLRRIDSMPGAPSWRGFRVVLLWMGLAGLACLRLLFTHGRVYEPIFTILLAGLTFVPMLHYRTVISATLGHITRLDRLSFHSYSLYLTHGAIVVFMALATSLPTLGVPGLVAIVLATNIFAVAFAFLFERPHGRVRSLLLRALA
jgi:peptidoglycan/LPS O-acetylase OafA/YrhL